MKLPRAIRTTRAQARRPALDPHGFNRGFETPRYPNGASRVPDGLRSNVFTTRDQSGAIAAIHARANASIPRARGLKW